MTTQPGRQNMTSLDTCMTRLTPIVFDSGGGLLSPSRAVVSWYSSHEKDGDGKTITAIYMAELELDK